MAKKQEKPKEPEAEPAGPEIVFDEGSFTRAERRELQVRYGRHFDDLLLYVDTGLVRRDVSFERHPDKPNTILTILPPDAPEVISGLDGSPAFADDVLIAMLLIVAKRDNPQASEAMFEDYTTADLIRSIRAGNAQARKRRESET